MAMIHHDHFWLNEGTGERISNLVGGLEDEFFIFHFIYGMSSFRRTLIFQDGYCTLLHHQPENIHISEMARAASLKSNCQERSWHHEAMKKLRESREDATDPGDVSCGQNWAVFHSKTFQLERIITKFGGHTNNAILLR